VVTSDYEEFDTAPEPLPAEAVRRRSSVDVHVRFGNADLAGWLLESLAPEDDEAVLEYGCGVGNLSLPLARALARGGRLAAVDFEPQYEKAWEILEGIAELPVEFKTLEPTDTLPWRDGAFDLAVAVFTLQFIPDLERSVNELHRLLKPGGRLFVVGGAPDDQAAFRRFYDEIIDCEPQIKEQALGRDLTTQVLPVLEAAFGAGERSDFTNVLRFPRPVDLVEYFASSRLYRELEADLAARDDLMDTLYHVAEDTIGREGAYTVTRHLSGVLFTR
jgi:SAM-dependent methyltransferase